MVAAKRFREDLYYRIGRPTVALPALRERAEDLPWLVQLVLARRTPTRTAHVSLVEAALARPWPGNIRELAIEIGDAARRADQTSDALVRAAHLDTAAGMPFEAPATTKGAIDRARIEAALQHAGGNISEAARELGVHRTQLRRWLGQYEIDPVRYRDTP